jgi:hypothetical protein
MVVFEHCIKLFLHICHLPLWSKLEYGRQTTPFLHVSPYLQLNHCTPNHQEKSAFHQKAILHVGMQRVCERLVEASSNNRHAASTGRCRNCYKIAYN